jgi:hypothetical protein
MESHGLWLRCALDAKGITRDEALAQLSMLLELLLPQEQTNLPKTVAD